MAEEIEDPEEVNKRAWDDLAKGLKIVQKHKGKPKFKLEKKKAPKGV